MKDFHKRIPSLAHHHNVEWSTLGEPTKAYADSEPEDLPLCGSCLDVDVFPHSDMLIRVLTYKEDGKTKTWHIAVNDFCDSCSSDGKNAERRQAVVDSILPEFHH